MKSLEMGRLSAAYVREDAKLQKARRDSVEQGGMLAANFTHLFMAT
jgi:hypothetical protein